MPAAVEGCAPTNHEMSAGQAAHHTNGVKSHSRQIWIVAPAQVLSGSLEGVQAEFVRAGDRLAA
jgi:hypothetical protein